MVSLAEGSSVFIIKRKYTEKISSLHNVLLHLHVLDITQEYGFCVLSVYLLTCTGGFMNSKYLCTSMKTYGTNWSLKQG